jgi:hypothetical protein
MCIMISKCMYTFSVYTYRNVLQSHLFWGDLYLYVEPNPRMGQQEWHTGSINLNVHVMNDICTYTTHITSDVCNTL